MEYAKITVKSRRLAVSEVKNVTWTVVIGFLYNVLCALLIEPTKMYDPDSRVSVLAYPVHSAVPIKLCFY